MKGEPNCPESRTNGGISWRRPQHPYSGVWLLVCNDPMILESSCVPGFLVIILEELIRIGYISVPPFCHLENLDERGWKKCHRIGFPFTNKEYILSFWIYFSILYLFFEFELKILISLMHLSKINLLLFSISNQQFFLFGIYLKYPSLIIRLFQTGKPQSEIVRELNVPRQFVFKSG